VSGWLFKKKSITIHGNMNEKYVRIFVLLPSRVIMVVQWMRQPFSIGPSFVGNSSNFHPKTEVDPVPEAITFGMIGDG